MTETDFGMVSERGNARVARLVARVRGTLYARSARTPMPVPREVLQLGMGR